MTVIVTFIINRSSFLIKERSIKNVAATYRLSRSTNTCALDACNPAINDEFIVTCLLFLLDLFNMLVPNILILSLLFHSIHMYPLPFPVQTEYIGKLPMFLL